MEDVLNFLTEVLKGYGIMPVLVLVIMGMFGAFIVMFVKVVNTFSQSINTHNKDTKSLTDAIRSLTRKVESPYLSTEQAVLLFREIMRSHIEDKLKYVGSVLRKNSIHKRAERIKTNTESEFRRITNLEAEKLKIYKTTAGDLGKVLQEGVNWRKFMPEVWEILFSDSEESIKIMDLRALMNVYVDQLVKIIETRGLRN